MKGMPAGISIEPTTSCNLRCPECPSGLRSFTRNTGMLSPGLLDDILQQIHKELIYLTLYFQGEPYLNPNFFDLVDIANRYNVYSATSTNAHYLDEENARKTVASGLDRLIISIDGTTQETYEQYRIGGNLEKVMDGTRRVVEWKRKLKSAKPYLIFQFLVVKPNEHQVDEVRSLAKTLGVDTVKLKTAQIYEYENGSPLIPDNPVFSRYRRKRDGTYAIKNKLLNQCWRMWQSCVITWDGKVVPCCFDKDATHRLGDLSNMSFRDVWLSREYDDFRRSILKSRKEIDICRNCTEGTKIFA
jgi:radical SAM protein with 4Fe4S-binding SPASM domain